MEQSKRNRLPGKIDKKARRAACLSTFCRLKRASREGCRALTASAEQGAVLRKKKKKLEKEHNLFNPYRLSLIDEHLSDLEAWAGYFRMQMAQVGAQVYQTMHQADGLLNFHDKCQVLSRNHRAVARQMKKRNIEKDCCLNDMVNIYDLEAPAHNEPAPPLYSWRMPLFTACHIFMTHEIIHNSELAYKGKEMFKEMFAGMSAPEFFIDHKKRKYLQRLPLK